MDHFTAGFMHELEKHALSPQKLRAAKAHRALSVDIHKNKGVLGTISHPVEGAYDRAAVSRFIRTGKGNIGSKRDPMSTKAKITSIPESKIRNVHVKRTMLGGLKVKKMKTKDIMPGTLGHREARKALKSHAIEAPKGEATAESRLQARAIISNALKGI